jgi:hypothetical protein
MLYDYDYPLVIPINASINIPKAIKKALVKIPRAKNPRNIDIRDISHVRDRLSATRPAFSATVRPVVKPGVRKVYYKKTAVHESPRDKSKRIKRELLNAGVTLYGLLKSESRHLPKIIHDNEHIEAVVYGQHNSSSAMMVATDERIFYLDMKPMAELFDEVSYEVVSGIQFDVHLFFATVVLHTPVRNYDFKNVNLHCADKFARLIEIQRLEREQPTKDPLVQILPNVTEPPRHSREHPNALEENMAGYYWLPMEEEEREKAQLIAGP